MDATTMPGEAVPSPAAPLLRGLEAPATALVTGGSSGIGLAVVAALLARADVTVVHAVARGAADSAALAALAERHGARLRPLAADLTDDADLARLAARLRADGPLHLVFNAAGLLHGDGLRPEKSLGQVRRGALERVFAVNAFAPILLAQALLPAMRHGAPAVFASLSARVGSIGDNRAGGWYAYRAAKAAQNQLLRTLAVECRRTHPMLACVLLHPGTVDTPLSAPFKATVEPARLFAPGRAAAQLLGVIGTLGPADSGRFLAWDGQEVPW
jgi:NAD(P)-dependent dehydrogenase (short-subunit alcohol dehydrogenase family)